MPPAPDDTAAPALAEIRARLDAAEHTRLCLLDRRWDHRVIPRSVDPDLPRV